ncbi:hypothetical protein Tco_1256860 [Tanacetum coccineum]
MDIEVTDSSIQQNPEQMDEEFTTTAYPNVQENLKLPTKDQVRLEEPASSVGTLSSIQNLDKEFSFTNQFLEEKSPEDEPEKTNTESKVQSIVTVPIHQDTSSVPLMTTLVIDLTVSQPVSTTVQALLPTSTTTRIGELEQHMADLLQDNLALEERLDKHGSRLYKLENLDIPYQVRKVVDEIVTDDVDWAIQAPLRDRFRDLPKADMKEILHHRMWETKSYEAHEDHKNLKKKRRHESPKTPPGSPPHQPPPPSPPAGPSKTSGASGASGSFQLPPPPPPPSTNQSDQSKSTFSPSSSKITTSAEYTAWTTTNTRLKPSVSSIPEDLHMDADSAPDEQLGSYEQTKRPAYITTTCLVYIPSIRPSVPTETLEQPALASPMPLHPENVVHLCSVTVTCQSIEPGQSHNSQADIFFNKDFVIINRKGSKGVSDPALDNLSKMKRRIIPMFWRYDKVVEFKRLTTQESVLRTQMGMAAYGIGQGTRMSKS